MCTYSDDACGELDADLPPHLRGGTHPSEIPGRVAAIRDALQTPRREPPAFTVVPPYEGEPDW